MRSSRLRLAVMAVLVCAAGAFGALATSASAFVEACGAFPWMDNVPRGSLLAAPNKLCVANDGAGNYWARDYVNPPHKIRLAARLHVELRFNGRTIRNSREYVTPTTPVMISTGWVHHPGGGRYCARLWNHDVRGVYVVETWCHTF